MIRVGGERKNTRASQGHARQAGEAHVVPTFSDSRHPVFSLTPPTLSPTSVLNLTPSLPTPPIISSSSFYLPPLLLDGGVYKHRGLMIGARTAR
jgi:hypothetical protein